MEHKDPDEKTKKDRNRLILKGTPYSAQEERNTKRKTLNQESTGKGKTIEENKWKLG